MNLQPIDSSASKQEEIDLLNKVAKLFGKGTYMADFFSEKLLGWVEEQLKNDFPPELYEAAAHEKDEHSKTLASSLKKDKRIAELEAMVESQKDSIATIRDSNYLNVSGLEADIDSYRTKWEQESYRADGLVASNTQLQEEVKRLKAMIFDLEHPSK